MLYVPVETKAREFLGKTFLAARAVERGWTVILGEANKVRDYMLEQPAGAYIEIGIPEKKAKRLENLRGSGYRIANMCEEGLVYSNGLEYCTRKLGRTSIAMTDSLTSLSQPLSVRSTMKRRKLLARSAPTKTGLARIRSS